MSFDLFSREFYEDSASVVAPELLGHYLLRRINDKWCGGIIAETEAYVKDDPACHAYIGGKTLHTPRVKVLWGRPGHAYVYVIYGMYHCFNVACCPEGMAEAVLVRAIVPTHNLETMQRLRPVSKSRQLTNGPGKLCKAMSMDRDLDGEDLCDLKSEVIIAKNSNREFLVAELGSIAIGPRIGLKVAADWPLRFGLRNSEFLSRKF
ncbi:MAG: DNA-3-methyladenine glycosylase [Abditibacteriaceae bacterium]